MELDCTLDARGGAHSTAGPVGAAALPVARAGRGAPALGGPIEGIRAGAGAGGAPAQRGQDLSPTAARGGVFGECLAVGIGLAVAASGADAGGVGPAGVAPGVRDGVSCLPVSQPSSMRGDVGALGGGGAVF